MNIITVNFKNEPLEIFDNFISIKKLCENLGVDKSRQYKKIQADDSYQSEFKEIEINGITQKVLCIPYNKINGWLFSISVNRVKPEVKQKLIEYKNECFNVLHDYFNKGYAMKPELQEALEFQIKQHEDTILSQNKMIAQGSSSGPSQENFRILMSEHEELQVENYLLRKQNMKMTQFIESFQTQSQNMIASVQTLKAISH